MRSLVYAALLCVIGTAAQHPFGNFDSMKNIARQQPNKFAHKFLGGHVLQQQNRSVVNIELSNQMSIDITVGSQNASLSMLPMIHSGYSGLWDVSCDACPKNDHYNVTLSNSARNGTSNITSVTSAEFGYKEGKAIMDSFCLENNPETCSQNNT